MASLKDTLKNVIEQDRAGDQIRGLKLGINFYLGPVQRVEVISGDLIVAQHLAAESSSGSGLVYSSVRLKPNQKRALSNRGVRIIGQ